MNDLERFKEAQGRAHAGYAQALAEMRAGHKRSHFIWYIFPQLAGLGSSPMAERYGLAGIDEATRYLKDPVLRSRLLAVASAAAEHLRRGVPVQRLMGSSIDALKLVSSMTLFREVARRYRADDDGVPENETGGGGTTVRQGGPMTVNGEEYSD